MGATQKGGRIRRPELTEMLTEAPHIESMFLAEKLFPVKTEKTQAGEYYKRTIAGGGLMRAEGYRREPKGPYKSITSVFEKDSFKTLEHGLKEPVDAAEAAEVEEIFDAQVEAGKNVRRRLMMEYEIDVKNAIFNASAWAPGVQNPVVNYTESLLSTIDFVQDIQRALEAFTNYGQIPNTVVLSSYLFNQIRRSPKLQAYIFGPAAVANQQTQISLKHLEGLFDIPLNFHIARLPVDLSKDGDDSPNIARVWPTSHIFLGNVQGGSYKSGGIGRTIVWDADSPGGLFTTDTYVDDDIRCDVVRVRSHRIEKIIDPTAGLLIATNYSAS
jgi:hypothetical protein